MVFETRLYGFWVFGVKDCVERSCELSASHAVYASCVRTHYKTFSVNNNRELQRIEKVLKIQKHTKLQRI